MSTSISEAMLRLRLPPSRPICQENRAWKDPLQTYFSVSDCSCCGLLRLTASRADDAANARPQKAIRRAHAGLLNVSSNVISAIPGNIGFCSGSVLICNGYTEKPQ